MNRLEKYIIKNLSVLFLSIFLSLFTIASVIFLIKLATYTAVVQLTTLDMLKLFIFIIPELLFFTLPISFIVAAALTIFKLSNDNEIIVLFALGIHPKIIVKILFIPAFLLSLLLLFNFSILFPHTKVLSKNYITYKTSQAKFNLSASEFGHKFGDWLLYLGKENKDGTYSDIFLFNKNDKEELLIKANHARILNKDSLLRLKLQNGEAYNYSNDKFTQTNFEIMYINNSMQTNYIASKPILEYWFPKHKKSHTPLERYDMGFEIEKKKKKVIINTVLSLFPMLSLFFIASISIIHVRHQKAKIYVLLFLGILTYYGATLGLASPLQYYTIPVVIFTWLITTYIFYKQTIVKRF